MPETHHMTPAELHTGQPTCLTQRSIHVSLLQILGALSIVGFHIGIPYSEAGWMVVDIFFVLAGVHMSAAFDREQSVASYAWSRVRRFLPEVGMVWAAAILFVVLGSSSAGLIWFTATAPFFLQNLTASFFDYSMPRDWVFTPLWFVAALLQLQVLLFASKRWWLQARPISVILVAVCLGASFRALFALFAGGNVRTLSDSTASALYCLPFAHVEAIVLGVLMGRGALVGIGRLLPFCVATLVALGALNIWLGHGEVTLRSGGYMFPLRLNGIHLWGYTALAFTAASLCAKDGTLARFMARTQLVPWLGHGLTRLGSLTYGVYVFHGIIMATGINGSTWLSRDGAPVLRLLLFAVTVFEAFLFAWTFAWCSQVAFPRLWRSWRTGSRESSPESRIPV